MATKTHTKTTIAAMGDIHIGETSRGEFNELFEEISTKADVLVLCGDLTQRGLMNEVEILSNELLACKIPVVAVLGNHDFEAGKQEEMTKFFPLLYPCERLQKILPAACYARGDLYRAH